MKQINSFLVTSEELQIIAAVSNINVLFMFEPKYSFDRIRQIQTINKLINEGFLIREKTGLKLSAQFNSIIDVLKFAKEVVVANSIKLNSLPACIYYSEIQNKCVLFTPQKTREDTYRIAVINADSLIEELEMLSLLPTIKDYEFFVSSFNNFNGIYEENCEMLLEEFKDNILCRFEKYCTNTQNKIHDLTILLAGVDWIMFFQSIERNKVLKFNKNDFISWLKGVSI